MFKTTLTMGHPGAGIQHLEGAATIEFGKPLHRALRKALDRTQTLGVSVAKLTAIDAILGQSQTVIKSLGKAYKNVEGIAGATILGDGPVALILDVPKLYQTAARESSAA